MSSFFLAEESRRHDRATAEAAAAAAGSEASSKKGHGKGENEEARQVIRHNGGMLVLRMV